MTKTRCRKLKKSRYIWPLNDNDVQHAILEQGKTATESAPYFLNNFTKGIQDTTATKNFARGYVLCRALCCVSIGYEKASGIIV